MKQTKNLDLGGRYLVYTGYFWLNAQGRSEVIRCNSDYRQPCVLKQVGRRAKWVDIWDSGH